MTVMRPLVQTSDIHDREVSLALTNDPSLLYVGDFGVLYEVNSDQNKEISMK